MDEPTPVVKKKRKYQRRGTHKLVLDGKGYVGSDITREGKFLVLKTVKGCVMANLELSKVVEVVGEIRSGVPIPITASGTSPMMSGGAVAFSKNRNRELEGLMAMPGGIES